MERSWSSPRSRHVTPRPTAWKGAAALLVFAFAATAVATSAAAQPATRVISGIVRGEQDRVPLAGATVELTNPRFTRRVRTDEGGGFRFGTLAPGGYRLSVLRLGFAPLVQQVTIADEDAELDVTLTPDPRTLNAVVTRANVTAVQGGIGAAGLSRNVNGERSLSAVPGARVQVLGSRLETETDSLGRFFLEVGKAGRYLVRVTSPGLVPQVYPVDVPRNKSVDASRLLDSARVIEAERPAYLWQEMDRRIEARGINSAIATGDEVRRYGGSMSTALKLTSGMGSRGLTLTGAECVFIDGTARPNTSLDDIRPEEVEAIEVYGLRGDPTNSLLNSWKGTCGAASGRQTNSNAVVWVVIWTVR